MHAEWGGAVPDVDLGGIRGDLGVGLICELQDLSGWGPSLLLSGVPTTARLPCFSLPGDAQLAKVKSQTQVKMEVKGQTQPRIPGLRPPNSLELEPILWL